jgi:hypothetical protein
MKLNLDNQFVNLAGEPLPIKMDDTLAEVLAMASTDNPRKMIGWATSLLNDGEIEVIKDEAIFLKHFIENNFTLNNLAKSQLIEQIENLAPSLPDTDESINTSAEELFQELKRQASRI